MTLREITVNGGSLEEYINSHRLIHAGWDANNNSYLVDLTDCTKLYTGAGKLELENENSDNTIEIGWYKGTDYYTATLQAKCFFCTFDVEDYSSCSVERTQNGYAVVELSAVSEGICLLGLHGDEFRLLKISR